jgi:hypothetical protein
LLAYLYTKNLGEDYKIQITLNNPPEYIFASYGILPEKLTNVNNFNYKINKHLLSVDNLKDFLEKNKEQNFLKFFNNDKKNNLKKYYLNDFNKKIGIVKERNQQMINTYYLIYPETLEGDIFFSNYVKFTQEKATYELVNEFKKTILAAKTSHLDALRFLEQLQIDQSTAQNLSQINLYNSIRINDSNIPLFLLGKETLKFKIKEAERAILKLENEKFSYDLILELSLFPKKISNHNINILIALIFGFFLSSLIIFFKNMMK